MNLCFTLGLLKYVTKEKDIFDNKHLVDQLITTYYEYK